MPPIRKAKMKNADKAREREQEHSLCRQETWVQSLVQNGPPSWEQPWSITPESDPKQHQVCLQNKNTLKNANNTKCCEAKPYCWWINKMEVPLWKRTEFPVQQACDFHSVVEYLPCRPEARTWDLLPHMQNAIPTASQVHNLWCTTILCVHQDRVSKYTPKCMTPIYHDQE